MDIPFQPIRGKESKRYSRNDVRYEFCHAPIPVGVFIRLRLVSWMASEAQPYPLRFFHLIRFSGIHPHRASSKHPSPFCFSASSFPFRVIVVHRSASG
jgi:hypothetical protein